MHTAAGRHCTLNTKLAMSGRARQFYGAEAQLKRPKFTRLNWCQQPLIYSKQEQLNEQIGRGDLTVQKLKCAPSKTCLHNCLSSSHLHFN